MHNALGDPLHVAQKGCPATSATVERLFSAVGLAFSDQRKSSSADTLADIAFTKLNLD